MSMKPTILYEDNHLIAVSKPAGMLVQGDNTGDQALDAWTKAYIKKAKNKPGNVYLGVIHRIDRPVSGLVLFAKTSKALTRMNELFRDNKIQKTYYALADKKPKKLSQTLINFIEKDKKKNRAVIRNKGSKHAKSSELTYHYIGTANHKFLLRVLPKTGRPHQIRVQLSHMGNPIVGDLKYGSEQGKGHFIYLHAYSLDFIHPVTKEKITLQCPLPDEMNWNFFNEYIS
jgi:23S rRNA pseudouridine1911/1915/1917 synthase